jgi:hypothetical protein
VAPIHLPDVPLNLFDCVACAALEPASVEVVSDGAKLDDEVLAEVLRGDFASFFLPKPDQLRFVWPHDDPRVGTSDKRLAISHQRNWRSFVGNHGILHRCQGKYQYKMLISRRSESVNIKC